MRTTAALLGVLTVAALFGCADTVAQPDRPVVGTTWIVTSLISPQSVISSAALESSAPQLVIAEDGAVTGSTGCNRLTGNAQVSEHSVTFGPLATTRMACPEDVMEVERAVLAVLDGETEYTVDADTMRLMRADGIGLELRAE